MLLIIIYIVMLTLSYFIMREAMKGDKFEILDCWQDVLTIVIILLLPVLNLFYSFVMFLILSDGRIKYSAKKAIKKMFFIK